MSIIQKEGAPSEMMGFLAAGLEWQDELVGVEGSQKPEEIQSRSLQMMSRSGFLEAAGAGDAVTEAQPQVTGF